MKKGMFLKLSVSISKQGRRFVAYSPALDISTSGKSEKDAKKNFEEVVNLFFEEIIEAGTAHDVLTELGWKRSQRTWTPPQVVSTGSVAINIPVAA